MHALLVAAAVALCAAPTPVEKARELAQSGSWIDLYLAYSSGDPGAYKAPQRKELSALLVRGAKALEKEDGVMAFSLAERAADFDPSAEALLVLGRTARGADQRGSAEKAYRLGMKKYPKDGAFPLALGKLLWEEHDAAGASQALAKVPVKAKEAAEATVLLAEVRAALAQEREAEQTARALDRRINGGGDSTRPAVAIVSEDAPPTTLTYESSVGPGGMRTRANSRFVFRYFNNDRDFGQRAEYEGRVAGALDEAYMFTRRILGKAREAPCDVVMYTRDEFIAHHGAAMGRMVAGFYSDSAIRMNDAAEINGETKATLVHEYVHAAVDEFAGGNARNIPRWLNEGLATYVEWRYLGADKPPLHIARALEAAAKNHAVPSLEAMTQRALIEQTNPALAYGTAGVAVKLMLKRGGVDNLLGLIAEVGAGQPFEEVLLARYDRTLARLSEDVADELSSR